MYSRVTEFNDYLFNNYIQYDTTFPTTLQAALDNNGGEAFNSKFKTEIRSPYPNIFEFLKCVKNIQKCIKYKTKHYLKKKNDSLTFVRCVS